MTDEIIVVDEPGAAIMPMVSVDDMLARYRVITEIKDRVMTVGLDYGIIPGTGGKPTLLKPGAEKLCTAFGLVPHFERLSEPDLYYLMQPDLSDVPFFIYEYRCTLTTRDGRYTVGQGVGSCNSWEKKYRHRKAERVCPQCGAAAIIKGKQEFGGGWLCWQKKDGCNAKFQDNDPAIVGQEVGNVPNPDIADAINTIDKMAQKRALIAATLVAVGASEFFTQDIEDIMNYESESVAQSVPVASKEAHPPALAQSQPISDPAEIITPVFELDSTFVMQVGFKLVGARDTGMTHMKHYTNRWQKRFGVNHLDEITVPFNEFIQVMSIPSDKWEAAQAAYDDELNARD